MKLSGPPSCRHRDARDGGEGGHHVNQADQLAGSAAGLDVAGPADDERLAVAAFPEAALVAAERTVALVAVGVGNRAVLVAVVHDPAVVAADDDQRVVGQLEAVERVEHGADGAVEFLDDVAADAATALAAIGLAGDARHVDVVRGEIEEERLVLVPLDEADGLLRERVGHQFIDPPRRLAAAHPADAADAVDDGVVVAVARLHLQQFGVFLARWVRCRSCGV